MQICHGQSAKRPITKEELARKSQNNPVEKARRGAVADPQEDRPERKKNLKEPILELQVVEFNGNWTYVPKESILNIPERFADRLRKKGEGKYVSWSEFHRKNVAWVETQVVTIRQASGEDILPEAVLERINKSTRLVIATYNQRPITLINKSEK